MSDVSAVLFVKGPQMIVTIGLYFWDHFVSRDKLIACLVVKVWLLYSGAGKGNKVGLRFLPSIS